MKYFIFIAILLGFQEAKSQERRAQSISIGGTFSPYLTQMRTQTINNRPGLNHEFRLNPYMLNIAYTRQLYNRWSYYVTGQMGMIAMQSRVNELTSLVPSPSSAQIESRFNELEALQWMLGGGVKYAIWSSNRFGLHLNTGLSAALTSDFKSNSSGIQLMDPLDGFTYKPEGSVVHEVSRAVVPFGQIGLGSVFKPRATSRWAFGLDVMYGVSPHFMRGNWSRNIPNGNLIAT
jgi:hypothetical protein